MGYGKEGRKNWEFFTVVRTDGGAAKLTKLPKVLRDFKSEYHYLFSLLREFVSHDDQDFERLYSLPNVTRRFMEAFGGIMIPTHEGLEKKMERIFPDPAESRRVLKFIADYSHQNSVMRSLGFPDVSECKTVVRACLAAVKEWDQDYYSDLETSIATPAV